MKLFNSLLAAAISAAFAVPASASLMATASINAASLGAGEYQYDITLNNVGTTTIGTFWFAWEPGFNYLTATPTNIVSPPGWSFTVTTEPGKTDAGILWTAGAQTLAAGESLAFSFRSTETPEALSGQAPPPNTDAPITTSFVYSAGPFSDAGYEFSALVSSVPLPGSFGLLMSGLVGGIGLAHRRQRVA